MLATSKKNGFARARLPVLAALSFCIPAMVMLLVYRALGFAPFGDASILQYDMSGQYVEFFSSLKNGVVYFSWNSSLGLNTIGTFAYYLSSPLSWITLFFSNADMPIALLYLTVLKYGLCGLSFFLFTCFKFGRLGPANLMFSSSYALMAYNIAYSMCIMWMDAVILLPIVILGIDSILGARKPWLLIFSYAACVIANYYMAYMVGVYAALYFLWAVLLRKTSVRYAMRRLAICLGAALLAVGISAPLTLPVAKTLVLENTFPGIGNPGTFSPGALWKNLLPGRHEVIGDNTAPYIFCGSVVLVLFLAFFFLPAIPRRAKIVTGVFFAALLFSIWFAPLNLAWHVFQYPNSFPFRQAFVLGFTIVAVAFFAYTKLPPRRFKATPLLLAALCALDLCYNAYTVRKKSTADFDQVPIAAYQTHKSNLAPMVEYAMDDPGFYRLETHTNVQRTYNDPYGMGYRGMAYYVSTNNVQMNDFLARLGFSQQHYWVSHNGATPVTDSLLGFKYYINQWVYTNGTIAMDFAPDWYSVAMESETNRLYQNPYALPLGFAAYLANGEGLPENAPPLEAQNLLLQSLAGTGEAYYTTIAQGAWQDGSNPLTFVSDGNPIFVDVQGYSNSNSLNLLHVNGEAVAQITNTNTSHLHYGGTYPAGTPVTLHFTQNNEAEISYTVGTLDMDAFAATIEALREGQLRVTGYGDTWLTGTVDIKEGQSLFTSIPYDTGWAAYVDGKPVPTGVYADAMLLLEMPPGAHTVRLEYHLPGFWAGVVLCILALLASGGWWLLYKRRQACQSKA